MRGFNYLKPLEAGMRQEDITKASSRGTNYEALLDAFDGINHTNQQCVQSLMGAGFTLGQARNAVYQYRKKHGLVRARLAKPVAGEDLRRSE